MFVYVAEFENRPGLIKIGVAQNVKLRMSSLCKAHGNVTRLRKFNVGSERYTVESDFHKKYANYNERLPESCDGYTEFFSDCVRDEVEILLKAVAEKIKVPVGDKPQGAVKSQAKSDVKPYAAPVKSRMDYEREMSFERLKTCNLADKRWTESRARGNEFLKKLFYRPYYGTFSCLHYSSVHVLASVVGMGVHEDAVLSTVCNVALSENKVRLTAWRARVVVAAINDTRSKIRKEFWRRVYTNTDLEAFYLKLAEDSVVDESTLSTLLLEGERIEFADRSTDTDYLCGELRRLLLLREDQVLRR